MTKATPGGAPLVIGGERRAFRFALASDPDAVWELPLLTDLPMEEFMRIRRAAGGTGDEALDVMVAVVGRLAPGLLDAASVGELAEVMRAWNRESGMGLGESSAS